MKKILIMTTKTAQNTKNFSDGIKKYLSKDIKIINGFFEDISIDFNGTDIKIIINRRDIKDYNLVYFRKAGTRFLWLSGIVALYLSKWKVKFFDTAFAEVGTYGTKLSSFVKLSLNGLPVIPSYYCYKDNIPSQIDLIIDKFGLPLIAKDLISQRGSGVFLLRNKTEFENFVKENPDRRFMFQKFLTNKTEYRVLVLGEKVGAYEIKKSCDVNEFRNNVALGAKEQFIGIESIPEEIKNISIKASKILKIEIAGVDILIDENDKPWILEVNRGPGLTYYSDVSPELKNLSAFFSETVT